jgi:hypothetical protein
MKEETNMKKRVAAPASSKAMKAGLLAAVLLTAAMGAAFAQDAASAEPKVLHAGDGAKTVRFENMHQMRFIEFFMVTPDPKTGKLIAPCFNSMYTSKGSPTTKDTSPQALVEGLDCDKIAKEHGVLKASLNGPKIWMPDWVEVQVGAEIECNGITLGWCAQLALPSSGTIDGAPYEPMQITRSSKWGWAKGTKAVLLDDPKGDTWILKGFQLGLKPAQTYEDYLAKGAASYKKLPAGWKLRVVTLEKDVIEIPETGVATIMTDELFNVWDKCGPGMTNYKP